MTNPLALIIEDDQKLARIFATTLQLAKFETEIILDGKTALDRLKTTTPAVVVLDLHLPRVSGIDILNQIQTDERLKKTRIIIISADVTLARSLEGKTEPILVKPVSVPKLRDLAASLRPA